MILGNFIKFLAVAMFFIQCVSAQSEHFNVTIDKSGKSFSFPIFSRPGDDYVKNRINRFLQLSELQALAKKRTGTIFEQTKVNDGSIYGGKVWMNVKLYSNNHRILSLGFDESSCGATCTYWHRYYTFNPGNGDRMELRDLFTPNGFEQFSQKLLKKRSAKYRREVRKKVELSDQESYLGTLGCFETDDLTDYYIRGSAIVIDGENCLIKGQKFDGLDMYVRVGLPEFRPYLNRYGLAVFGLTATDVARFRSTALPQLFEGSIDGSLPVAIVLNREFDNGIRGIYAYLKHGAGIGLQGNLLNDTLAVTEYVLSPVSEMRAYGPTRAYYENGYISATLRGQWLKGTWSNKDRTQTLSLVASSR